MGKLGLERYYLNEEFSDVGFEVDDETLPAHKVILSAKSQVFKERLQSKDLARMNLGGVPVQSVKAMLRFVYQGQYVPEDGCPDIAVAGAYALAEQFRLTGLQSGIRESIENPDRWKDILKDAAKKTVVTSLAGAGTAVAGTAAGTAALGAAGFTSSGIAAGSLAAGIQASIGNVVAGSAFATLQSVGATGGLALLGPVGLGLGAVGASVAAGVFIYKRVTRPPKPENRLPSVGVANPFEFYLTNEELSDVTFLVEGEKIPAHRVILSVKSDVFRDMFREKKDENEIKIEDARLEPFQRMLGYLYRNRLVINDVDDEMTAQLYLLAEQFQLRDLKDLVEQMLMNERPS